MGQIMKDKIKILKLIVIILPLMGLFLPIWVIEFNAPMFGQRWLRIEIFGNGVVIGPIDQINIANHYVGLPEIHPDEMIEVKILPYIFILQATLLSLAYLLKYRRIFIILYIFISISIPAYLQYWLYLFGHNINYKVAAIKIEPFTPLVIGGYQIANFKIVTYLHIGYWSLIIPLIITYYMVKNRWL